MAQLASVQDAGSSSDETDRGDVSGQKRRRDDLLPDDSNSHNPYPHSHRTHRTKRQRQANGSTEAGAQSEKPPTKLILHEVLCDGQAPGHSRHSSSALYFDHPRLWKGDNKASALRGLERFTGEEEYLEEHSEVGFVVKRTYQCQVHHELAKDAFEKLPIPKLEAEVIGELRPYFYVLPEDSPLVAEESERMHISSDMIRMALGLMSRLGAPIEPGWESEENLSAPYLQFYHARKDIHNLMQQIDDKEAQAYAQVLLDYIEETFGPDYDAADDLFAQGQVSRGHLEKLFAPGEIIATKQDGEWLAFVAQNTLTPGVSSSMLIGERWDFDGSFRKISRQIPIQWPSFADTIGITDLNAFPLRFDPELQEALRKRGETFWTCRRRRYVAYNAPSATFEIQVSNPRYMIDMSMYRELSPKDQQDINDGREVLGRDAMDRDEPPSDPFVLLLPAKILAFGFHDKKWRSLRVEYIAQIEWNANTFESQLVLKPQKKDLIKALVLNHLDSRISKDVIAGKGNGLIILLHGGPGTGKTLTAESVAELAQRPLYRVTCGDIGTDPESVEKYLESVLYIGSMWQAVVLLDESDVFLEERTQTDLQRNALVSVFLRVLEYYEGILILTSNRVGLFDEAFKSRVQLALHYPDLDTQGRVGIWNNFINLLEVQEENMNIEELRNNLHVLAQHNLNGRQIRNAIATARQLARFKTETLRYHHLEQTIQVANEFEEYVKDTRGHTDREYAKFMGTRKN